MIKHLLDDSWEYVAHEGLHLPTDADWQPVDLPHDAAMSRPRDASYPTGGGGGYAWSGLLTYRKRLYVPEAWRGTRVLLEFEGVYMCAEVSVNRDLLAMQPYGYTSFVVDVTPSLKYGADNWIRVLVNNTAQPNSRWYSGTGIYRHVWLHTGGDAYIPPWGVFVTTPVVHADAATVVVTTDVRGVPGNTFTLRTAVGRAGGAPVASVEDIATLDDTGVATLRQTVPVTNPHLWSVDDPVLYSVSSRVLMNGELADHTDTTFGFRSVTMDAQHGLTLNGVPLKLKGGCVHHDNGLLGAASYDRAEERKVELMKAAGYNALRCAHNPPAPAMLDACDRLGMLVIDETFDCWRMGKNPNDYHLYFGDWWERDTAAMVVRDRNHPSVIMWSIGNEVPERGGISGGAEWAARQARLVHQLDCTRPVMSALPFLFEPVFREPDLNAGSVTDAQAMFDPARLVPTTVEQDRWGNLTEEFSAALDVVGYNYLYARYAWDAERFPERVIAGTETFPSHAYDTWRATEALPQVIGDFVWTSIDYLGESGIGKVTYEEGAGFQTPYPYHLANCGDIDICGFKRPQSYYRDLLWGVRTRPWIGVHDPAHHETMAHYNSWGWEPVEASWTFPGREGKPTRVDVYATDDEVELWVNGRLAGRQPAGEATKNTASFEVTYEPGSIEAIGYTGGVESGRESLATAGEPATLRLSSDRTYLASEGADLAYVTVEVVDAAGNRVPWYRDSVTLSVSGAGRLVALGTPDPLSEELYTGPARAAYQGRLMAVVAANGTSGEISVHAAAPGLADSRLEMEAWPSDPM